MLPAVAPDPRQLRRLAERQFDAVARAQILALGASGRWIDHRLRSSQWQRLHPGAYVVHSGPISWRTRAAAALLYAGDGAALSHRSAGFVHEIVRTPPTLIQVSVPHDRRVDAQPGLRVHRRRPMPATRGRLRAVVREETVLDLVGGENDDDDVVGIVCAAIRAGTRPQEIMAGLERRSRLRNRALLLELLDDVADGVESPLERRYRRRVETSHALPRSTLQVRQRVDDRRIRADVVYAGLGVRVELDGALAHPDGRTGSDTWRDDAVLIAYAEITLRYRWSHVAGQPCAVARQVARALRARGWTGETSSCGPRCQATFDS